MTSILAIFLIVFNLFFVSPQEAMSGVLSGVGSYDSGELPAGSVLVGITDSSDKTTSTTYSSNQATGDQYVAVATGTLATGKLYAVNDGTDSKMLVYDSTETLIATSDLQLAVTTGWNDYTFSAGQQPTITSGQTYRICIIADGTFNVYSSATGSMNYDSSGTLASPPASWSVSGSNPTRSQAAIYLTT